MGSSPGEEDGAPVLCDKCARSYETEASAARAKAEGTKLALTFVPGWPQADEPQTSHKVRTKKPSICICKSQEQPVHLNNVVLKTARVCSIDAG